jgi:hypothetical protein
MNLLKALFAAGLGLFCLAASAGETAYTVRATDLKAKPYTDAATVATLAQQSQVEIVTRRGSWNQVKAGGKTGWVKMLSLRLGSSAQHKTGDAGFRALFNVASTGSSGSTMTTGVRGLNEENLHNPHPNPHDLQELHGFEVGKAQAQQFAKAGKLTAEKMDYLPAPAK